MLFGPDLKTLRIIIKNLYKFQPMDVDRGGGIRREVILVSNIRSMSQKKLDFFLKKSNNNLNEKFI